jgi:hypothetical protein
MNMENPFELILEKLETIELQLHQLQEEKGLLNLTLFRVYQHKYFYLCDQNRN